MIKTILKKLFFADAPAQGAWFGMTLWGAGLYVMFSLLLILTAVEIMPPGNRNITLSVRLMQWLLVALSVYFGLMLFRFYYQSCRTATKRETAFWTVFALYMIIATASVYDGGAVGFAVMTMLFGAWLFPLLLIPKIRWCCYLAHALSWTVGTLLLIALPIRSIAEKNNIIVDTSKIPRLYPYEQTIINYQLSDGGWIFLVISCLLLLLAGYLLTAKILGDAWAVPFRRMFGKGVLSLWGLSIATYLVFLVMANIASRQAAQDIKDLEQCFGRPMTAETLGKLYLDNDQPDPKFWQKIAKYVDQCDYYRAFDCYLDYKSDTIPLPLLTRWRQQFDNPDLAAWEQAFAGNLPPDARQYKTGSMDYVKLLNINIFRKFSDLELWRIRFALMDNDIKSALDIYGRMKNADGYLLRETYLNAGFVWLSCENVRLDALQLLLESDKLSDTQLRILAADLQTTQKQIPLLYERCLHGQAVYDLDIFEMIGRGAQPCDGKPKTPPYQLLRFLIPQLWWYAAKDKSDTARYYNVKNFDELTNPTPPRNHFWLSDMLLPRLKSSAAIFDRLTARVRAAGVVIRAVEYQRRHGEYPKTLDNLPLDPFSNQPLQYRAGECEIEKSEVIAVDDRWDTLYKSETVPAVLCWSIGSDQIDNNGIPRYHTLGNNMSDDISFMIKIKP